MSVKSIYILHWPEKSLRFSHSELILYRSYRNDIDDPQVMTAWFEQAYKEKREDGGPFIHYKGLNFIYLERDDGFFLLAVCGIKANAMSTILFLKSFYDVVDNFLKDSQKQKIYPNQEKEEFREHTVLTMKEFVGDNTTLVIELLDECMDFGLIQIVDHNILKEYIKITPRVSIGVDDKLLEFYSSDEEESKTSTKDENVIQSFINRQRRKKVKQTNATHNQPIKSDLEKEANLINSSILRTTYSVVNWRPKGIYYAKNEIFFDIIEKYDFEYDLETQCIKHNEVYGICLLNCYLSGMPRCKIGFNEVNISRIGNEDKNLNMSCNNIADGDKNKSILSQDADTVFGDKDEDANEDKKDDTSVVESIKPMHKVPLNNVQFHQCIELDSLYRENLITFIPPDGKFTLLDYRVELKQRKQRPPLIMIEPKYKIFKSNGKLQVLCVLSTHFSRRLNCRDLEIKFPINYHIFKIAKMEKDGIPNMKYKAQLGEVFYRMDSSEVVWKIESIQGNCKSVKMLAELNLDKEFSPSISQDIIEMELKSKESMSSRDDDTDDAIHQLDQLYGVNGASSKPLSEIQSELNFPTNFNEIQLFFKIPRYSRSGLRLMYLSVEEEQMHYTCFPWIRYTTEAADRDYSKLDLQSHSRSSYRLVLGSKSFEVHN